MNLELRHLRLLVEIADRGGLTRAAASLHLTQSALSHQLRDAEEKLGTALFRREGRTLVRTDAGERILATARKVIEEMETAERDARRIAGTKTRQTIRLSTECYTCYYWLGPLMERFSKRFPDVDVEVVIEATRRPIQFLIEGKLDLGIVNLPTSDRRLQYEPILEDELVAILPPDHRLAAKPFLLPKDFTGENLVLYDTNPSDITFLVKFLKPAKVAHGRIHHVQLTEAILELVRAGRGVSALARWAIEPQAERLGLVLKPLGRKGLRREWTAVTRRGEVPPHIRELITLLATSPSSVRMKMRA